jgi:hypothetical protein
MSEEAITPKPEEGDEDKPGLVSLDTQGDPLPDPRATRMLEIESYERVAEGLKMSAEAAMHLAKHESDSNTAAKWQRVSQFMDQMRYMACQLANVEPASLMKETASVRGDPYAWRKARDRFLDGMKQASGGMRQLAVCFRADYRWSMMAQELEVREKTFRAMVAGLAVIPRTPPLIIPTGYVH